jgi:hypothetical protein
MKPHDTYLQLAAIAIDYPLAPADRGRLEAHLASCPACARSAHGFRADAIAFGDLPRVTLPERRAGEILAAAMHPPAIRHPLRLVLVAALLALLAIGSLAVGAEVLRRLDEEKLLVVPPVATETPGPVPSASTVPSASDVPSAPPVSGPVVVPALLPLPAGSVSLAPAAAGGVWVLVNYLPNLAGESGRAVLALLTKDGEPAPGWPQEIRDVDCSVWAGSMWAGIPASPTSQLPVVAPDGSVRLLCWTSPYDATAAVFALSFDASGAESPGWPVMLPSDPVDARMIDDTLVIATSSPTTDAEGNVQEVEYRILRISAAGQLEQGQAVAPVDLGNYAPNLTIDGAPNLAADGVAFLRWIRDQGPEPATDILAFGIDGALPGWPISVPGIVSAPVAGPDGRYYATTSAKANYDALAANQALVTLTSGGTLSVGLDLPVAGISEATFAGGYAPIRPVLEPGGSAWVPGVDTRDRVVVHALGPDGTVRDGWPWRAGSPIEEQGECGQGETGCGVWRTVPASAPGRCSWSCWHRLIVRAAGRSSRSGRTGGSLTAGR